MAIEDADGLHKVQALSLTRKQGRLTGKELKFLRVVMGLSQQGLGKRLGVGEQAVSLRERTGKVPQAGDSLTRLLISEKLNGNCKVTDVIERILSQRIVAREVRHKWTSKMEAMGEEQLAG